MDPLTAFSIASGVIQVLDFALETVQQGREIYQKGATAENIAIEKNVDSFEVATRELDQALQDLHWPAGPLERSLRAVASECTAVSSELVTEIARLKPNHRSGRCQAALKAVQMILRKDKIERIQRKLESCQRVLDTQILAKLMYDLFLLTLVFFLMPISHHTLEMGHSLIAH